MLSKHWDYPSVYPMILKLLITRGNGTLIPKETTEEKEQENSKMQTEKEENQENQKIIKNKNDKHTNHKREQIEKYP